MTTTFNTMPTSALRRLLVRRPIIAAAAVALALALGACSMIKLGYGQAAPLAFRWLDRYADFDDAQSLRVRSALDETLAWHRRTQLPDYVQLLARAEAEIEGEATPERMCAWGDEIRSRAEPLIDHVAPVVAEVMVTLSPRQLSRIETRFAENDDKYRDEHLQRNPERRRKAEVRREIERAELLYGALGASQRDLIVQSVAVSPFSAELALAEREARQQDFLRLARRLGETVPAPDDAALQVRAYLHGLVRSPRDDYRRHAERVRVHQCALASALHNAASEAQRRAAARRLAGWRADLRELAGEAAG